MSLYSALFLLFLILKLTHVIDWSWWWITSPIWIGVIVFTSLSLFIEWLKESSR